MAAQVREVGELAGAAGVGDLPRAAGALGAVDALAAPHGSPEPRGAKKKPGAVNSTRTGHRRAMTTSSYAVSSAGTGTCRPNPEVHAGGDEPRREVHGERGHRALSQSHDNPPA